MKLAPLFAALVASLLALPAFAADWLTQPSFYTHDPTSGERVNQYAAIGPFYYYSRPDYMKSGYRNLRSTIQAGGSADNLHIVETWGAPVVPYEQWRFQFRPYGSPYEQWGPPFGGLGAGGAVFNGPFGGGVVAGGGFGPGGGFGGPGFGAGPGAGPGFGPGGFGPGGGFAPGGGGNGMGPGGGGGFPGGGWGGGGGWGPGGGGGWRPGFGGPFNFAQPWMDGYYPSYDLNDRSQYYNPYQGDPTWPAIPR